jgi:hypothetical protein
MRDRHAKRIETRAEIPVVATAGGAIPVNGSPRRNRSAVARPQEGSRPKPGRPCRRGKGLTRVRERAFREPRMGANVSNRPTEVTAVGDWVRIHVSWGGPSPAMGTAAQERFT